MVVVVLDPVVAVFIFESKKAGLFPILKPLRAVFVFEVALSVAYFSGLDGFRKI